MLALPEGRRFYVLYELRFGPSPRQAARRRGQTAHAARARKARGPRPTRFAQALISLRKRGFNRLYQIGPRLRILDARRAARRRFRQARVRARRPAGAVARNSLAPDGLDRNLLPRGPRRSDPRICAGRRRRTASANAAPERLVFNERFECKKCGAKYQEPEPRLFSFNNPYGACPRCQGFGNTIDFDLDRVIPDKSKSLAEGAIEPWTKPRYRQLAIEMRRFARAKGIPLDVPFRELTAAQRDAILEGDRKEDFPGVKGFFAWLERKKYKLHVRVFLSRYRGYATCPDCHGTRLRAEARAVKIAGRSITEVCQMTVKEARPFFEGLQLSAAETVIADKVLEEIQQRLRFLDEVGLDYLTLDRLTSTLSGGEAQRIQLATSLGSHLVGALYVLDEPSIGLHPRDTSRLIDILKGLRDLGNTLLVVEHDPDTILAADHILDLGPGAGEHGGNLIFAGTREELAGRRRSRSPAATCAASCALPCPRAAASRRANS